MDIFSVPVGEKILIYAPFHNLAALVNQKAASQIRIALETGREAATEALNAIVDRARAPGASPPQPRSGPMDNPLFLGLIPTRGCNLGCLYCNFAASKNESPRMTLAEARMAVDAYLEVLRRAGARQAEVHFFGGEPFYAEEVIHFTVSYAASRCEELGMHIRFEAITNGFYTEARCRWIANVFDTIILSLDGLPDIQNRQRPTVNGRGSAPTVMRNAHILSEGAAELIVRACVTHETVRRMPEIAAWFAQSFRPSAVCFEAMVPSPLSQAAGLYPPDPQDFAVYFLQAAKVLSAWGIETVSSTGELRGPRLSCCPVGKDALIVSPGGRIDACYLLPEEWERRGLDLHLGRLEQGRFAIDPEALQRVRNLTVYEKSLCQNCLCRFHCAGGCHVHHPANSPPGSYDAVCVQTRLIAIARLLNRLGCAEVMEEWLANPQALEKAAWQANDRLLGQEALL